MFKSKETKAKWEREYYKKNPEYFKKKRSKLTKEKKNAYQKKYRFGPKRNEILERQRRYYRELRIKVLTHYGGKCNCCGETIEQFLTIDHINNGRGNPPIRPTHLDRWIVKNNYPINLQILCYNCNCAKGHFGKCPHQN